MTICRVILVITIRPKPSIISNKWGLFLFIVKPRGRSRPGLAPWAASFFKIVREKIKVRGVRENGETCETKATHNYHEI